MHTQMVEAAAADRVLFLNEAGQVQRRVEIRFPEYVSPLESRRADLIWLWDGFEGERYREN